MMPQMDSASGAPAMCLPHEKCAPTEECRLQAQYWLKFISMFHRLYLVQTTGWKQYLVASQGWAERCVGKTVHGEKTKSFFPSHREGRLLLSLKEQLWHRRGDLWHWECGIGKSAMGQLESGKLCSSAPGGEELLIPGAPGGDSRIF